MRKLISLAVTVLLLGSVCIMPVAAEHVEAGGYYEYPAENTDEILAGKAGEASVLLQDLFSGKRIEYMHFTKGVGV